MPSCGPGALQATPASAAPAPGLRPSLAVASLWGAGRGFPPWSPPNPPRTGLDPQVGMCPPGGEQPEGPAPSVSAGSANRSRRVPAPAPQVRIRGSQGPERLRLPDHRLLPARVTVWMGRSSRSFPKRRSCLGLHFPIQMQI